MINGYTANRIAQNHFTWCGLGLFVKKFGMIWFGKMSNCIWVISQIAPSQRTNNPTLKAYYQNKKTGQIFVSNILYVLKKYNHPKKQEFCNH